MGSKHKGATRMAALRESPWWEFLSSCFDTLNFVCSKIIQAIIWTGLSKFLYIFGLCQWMEYLWFFLRIKCDDLLAKWTIEVNMMKILLHMACKSKQQFFLCQLISAVAIIMHKKGLKIQYKNLWKVSMKNVATLHNHDRSHIMIIVQKGSLLMSSTDKR